MPRPSSVLVASVAGVLGGALIGGSALVGAQARSAPPASDSSSTTRPCGAALAKLPADLRKDLLAARAKPAGQERRTAVRQVRRDMLAGKYGDKAQRFAERRLGHRAELRSKLPEQLRQDLAALRDTAPEQRRDAAKKIREDALAGKYGDAVQHRAEKRQQRREECRSSAGSSS